MSSDRLNVKVVSNQNSVELTKNENTVVISDKNRDTSINVLQKETAVVTVASKGPKGDKGDKGDTGDTGIAVTNQITTGSITASVDIGTDTFKVQSGSSTFFNINSSGNVGIGVTNPTLGLLQVGTITNPHANVYITAGNTGTSSLTVRAINGFSGHQRTYNPVGGSDSLNFIQLLDGDTTSATDQPIGRIIFSSNDTDSGGTNTTKAFIEAVSEDATPDTFLAFGTAQASTSVTERMRITSVGNVGIGTTTPTNTLQVNGGITATSITSSLLGTASVAVTAQTASFLPVGTYSITSSWATNALTASNITPSITNNTDNRVLTATGGGTINGESNLTFDGSVLTVTGRANISTSITSSTATVGFGLTSALNAGQTTIKGSGVDTVGALIIQNTAGTATFTVLNGGTTGVGENNPSARLHVKGSGATSGTTALRVENSNASARLTILDDGTSAFNTNHLYVSASGNIGIGTTTPQSQLHITGANALFTLSPLHPLPTSSVPSASFATSGSGANLKPYFWNGSSWNALY